MDQEAFNKAVEEELAEVFGFRSYKRYTTSSPVTKRYTTSSPVTIGSASADNRLPSERLLDGASWLLRKISGAEKKEKIEQEKRAKEEEEEIEKQRLLERINKLDTKIYRESLGKNLKEVRETLKNLSAQKASDLLAIKDIRKHICSAIKSATDDVFDISKSVTPVLVGCIVSGTISIPLNPVLFAAIAVVIARMSVSALCAGHITK